MKLDRDLLITMMNESEKHHETIDRHNREEMALSRSCKQIRADSAAAFTQGVSQIPMTQHLDYQKALLLVTYSNTVKLSFEEEKKKLEEMHNRHGKELSDFEKFE